MSDLHCHNQTHPQLKKRAPLTTLSSSFMCASAPEHYTGTVLQNGQDNTKKASHKKQSIIEHSPGVPKDTKSLKSCFGNPAKMLLKSLLWIECNSQYIKVITLLQQSFANSLCGWLGMHCAWPGDCYCASLTRIQFHPQFHPLFNFVPFTNIAEVTLQGLCHCNYNAWGYGTTDIKV